MKYKWKINGTKQFWKDEFIQIKPSQDGEDLSQILSAIESELLKNDQVAATYLLEIPKDLIKNSRTIEEEVLIITPRKSSRYEENFSFFWTWHLNIFKNYKPYREWFNANIKCATDVKITKTSAVEFEDLAEEFFRSLKLKAFN